VQAALTARERALREQAVLELRQLREVCQLLNPELSALQLDAFRLSSCGATVPCRLPRLSLPLRDLLIAPRLPPARPATRRPQAAIMSATPSAALQAAPPARATRQA